MYLGEGEGGGGGSHQGHVSTAAGGVAVQLADDSTQAAE